VIDDECIGYGYLLTTTQITGTLAQHADKILVAIFLGVPQLAVYTIAILIPTRIKELLKALWSPFHPKISERDTKLRDVREKIKTLIFPLALMILGGSLLYWLFIDDVVLLLFSAKYMESTNYSRMLLLMILASIPTSFFGTFSIAKKTTKSIVLGYHISPILKLLIMFAFIYQWGILGAIWGLNLSTIVQALLFWIGMGSDERPLES